MVLVITALPIVDNTYLVNVSCLYSNIMLLVLQYGQIFLETVFILYKVYDQQFNTGLSV